MDPVIRRKIIDGLIKTALDEDWTQDIRVQASHALATFDLASAVRDADLTREISSLTEAVRDAGNVS